MAAALRANGAAVVAVVSTQLVFKIRIVDRVSIRDELRDPARGLPWHEQDFRCGLETQQGNK
jgi:hypothetical protein